MVVETKKSLITFGKTNLLGSIMVTTTSRTKPKVRTMNLMGVALYIKKNIT